MGSSSTEVKTVHISDAWPWYIFLLISYHTGFVCCYISCLSNSRIKQLLMYRSLHAMVMFLDSLSVGTHTNLPCVSVCAVYEHWILEKDLSTTTLMFLAAAREQYWYIWLGASPVVVRPTWFSLKRNMYWIYIMCCQVHVLQHATIIERFVVLVICCCFFFSKIFLLYDGGISLTEIAFVYGESKKQQTCLALFIVIFWSVLGYCSIAGLTAQYSRAFLYNTRIKTKSWIDSVCFCQSLILREQTVLSFSRWDVYISTILSDYRNLIRDPLSTLRT